MDNIWDDAFKTPQKRYANKRINSKDSCDFRIYQDNKINKNLKTYEWDDVNYI